MANWNILLGAAQPHQVAAGVAQGFQLGQEQRRESELRGAFDKLATNPDDPNAANALMRVDPQMGLRYRQQQVQFGQQKAKIKQEEEERDTKVIASMARNAQDPASWDAAVDQIVAMGYPEAAQFKGKFSPAVRGAVMAAGGLKDDEGQSPNIQREVEYYRSIGRPEMADQLLARHAEGPPIAVRNPENGTIEFYPANMARPAAASNGPQPGAVDVDDETGESFRFKGGNPQDPASWEPVGQGGAGSGPRTFP